MHRSMGWCSFYKKLSDYPRISDWEIRTIIEFIEYEKRYGRECVIECEESNVLNLVKEGIAHREAYLSTSRPKLLTECTNCLSFKNCQLSISVLQHNL